MKGRLIALDHLDGREAAALMVDGRLEDMFFESTDPPPGTIYRAVVDRLVKGQGGAFLKTPDGTAYLRQARGMRPGQVLTVQVSGHAEPGKALPVTTRLLFKSRYAIVTPDAPGFNVSRQIRDDDMRERLLSVAHETLAAEGGPGLILRSSAGEADEDALREDIAAMADLALNVTADQGDGTPAKLVSGDGPHLLAWREWTEPATVATAAGCFAEHGVLDALDSLGLPEQPLPQGGHLFVEPTRALVAIDVNTGADLSPAAALKANLDAARALPRHLRLRGLGGQIAIDFAPLSKRDRRQVETALRASFRADPVETALVGWTPLGHFELQRKRERVPMPKATR